MRALALVLAVAACGDNVDPSADANVGVPGRYTVSGVVRYEDKPPVEDGSLGPVQQVVARGISIALVAEDDDAMLATGVTADDGSYSLSFDGVSGEPVHVLAIASSTLPARPITIRRTGDGMIHGFGGATFPAGIETTHDVLVTIDSEAAQAFNIFDQLVHVMDRIVIVYATPTPVPLTAFWQVGTSDGTYYFDNEIYLLGLGSDDDGFDDTVIMHEAGHYVEDAYGRSNSPGGAHNGEPVDPRLAWSEGFSTYFALAIREFPVYMDSNADGGWSYNADTSITTANPSGAIGQRVSEDLVSEILWDMGDGGGGDDDPLAGMHDPVLALQTYLDTAALRQIGSVGVDLVDALDGWFVVNGLSSCAAMRQIVNTTHLFPYDYGGAAGPCP